MPLTFSPLVTYIKVWLENNLLTFLTKQDGGLFSVIYPKNARNQNYKVQSIAKEEKMFYEGFYIIKAQKKSNNFMEIEQAMPKGSAQINFRAALKKAAFTDKNYIEYISTIDNPEKGLTTKIYKILEQKSITYEELEYKNAVQLFINNNLNNVLPNLAVTDEDFMPQNPILLALNGIDQMDLDVDESNINSERSFNEQEDNDLLTSQFDPLLSSVIDYQSHLDYQMSAIQATTQQLSTSNDNNTANPNEILEDWDFTYEEFIAGEFQHLVPQELNWEDLMDVDVGDMI